MRIVMELFKLLGVNLIFIAIATATGKISDLAEIVRINKQSIKPIRYYINLIIYMNEDDYKNTDVYKRFKTYIDEERAKGNFIFYGEVTMLFESRNNETDKIHLHIRNLKIDEAKTAFTLAKIDVWQIPTMNIDGETAVLYFEHNFLPHFSPYRLIIKYVGSITDNTGGFFKIPYYETSHDREKKWLMVAANFRGTGARQIFPCWDEPDIRTNFSISIKHHQNYTVLSNAPIFETSTNDNGMVWTRFKTTPKISPHHVAIILSDLYQASITKVFWGRLKETQIAPLLKFPHAVSKNATLYLKQMFDEVFPLTVNHVVIPGFLDEGVESWGLILYRESAFIYDDRLDFVTSKFEVARMVARKVVHQYVGNMVGQSSWSYLWLNEGIATFLAMQIVNQIIHPRLMDLFVVQFQHESFHLNDYYDMPLISEVNTPSDINSLFSFTYFIKAPVFIRTLLQTISLHTLGIALNTYLITYRLRSTYTSSSTIDDFFDILQEGVANSYEPNKNLKRSLGYWTTQKRYPILHVIRKSSGNEIIIKLSQIYLNEYPEDLWLPVTYTTPNASNIIMREWLNPQKPILYLNNIKENDCIIVNVQQAGYYRVSYDDDNWQKLAQYLNSEKYFNIHVLNRAQIIDDAYYFLLTNKLNFTFFKNLTNYLSREFDFIAWYPMFKIFEHVSSFFPFPESTSVKEHFLNILELVLGKIGIKDLMEEEDDFTKCLRQEASKWVCTLNSQECKPIVNSNLERIMPGWKEWAFCERIAIANKDVWDNMLKYKVLNSKLLKLLACSKNHTIINGYIDLLKSGYFTEAQYRITIFHSIVARNAKNNLVLDYILQNFANVVPSEIDTIVALADIINHLYSKKQLLQIGNFVNRFSSKIGSYVDRKIGVRLNELERHDLYFKSFLF